jgi:glutathione S-transferase
MLTLYFAPNTCALASYFALTQVRADFRAERVDFASSQQRGAEYLRLNPLGRVPALATPRGVLTETPAILQFIAESFPDEQLAPLGDAFEMARMNAFNSYLCSTVHVAHAHRMRGTRWVDEPAALEAMKKKVPQTVGEAFRLIETALFRGPWVLGEAFSVSDFYLFTLARWLEGDSVEPAQFPQVAAHRERMAQLPAVQQVLAAQAAV